MTTHPDQASPEDQLFTVTTTVTLYAKDREEAAKKAFALHDTMTPEEYQVADAANVSKGVVLKDEDKDEARRAYMAGKYFREMRI